MKIIEIIVYSSENCGYCHRQKEFLQGNGFVFEVRDIAKKEHLQALKDFGGRGTPFTLIQEDGEVISKVSGFNKPELLKLLNIKQGDLNMKKERNEENTTAKEVEAKATVTATLKKGDQAANSARVDLTTNYASVTAKNTGTKGVLGVYIMDPTWIDEPIHSWFLNPGETFSSSLVQIKQKNSYYLRLYSYDKTASGTGSLAPSIIIA